MNEKRIYVASSWRNGYQPLVVRVLRSEGFDVYDFKHPTETNNGFQWSEIDPHWEKWTTEQFIKALDHPLSKTGFKLDFDAMKTADACVMVLPCGRSANIKAGYFVGAEKPLVIIQPIPQEPELMYKTADYICEDIDSVTNYLKGLDA